MIECSVKGTFNYQPGAHQYKTKENKNNSPHGYRLYVTRMTLPANQKPNKHVALQKYNNRGIHADVIVYIFAHLHTTFRTEENLLGIPLFRERLSYKQ